ncbi:MAG: HAMP domain-containing histidine kinase [Chloroflexi bacterium]|nr:HAMP domain-containing histidine kinase [Chloroflexota bacterium]
MDTSTLTALNEMFSEVTQKTDWRAALDMLFVSLRGEFVFDNVAVYLLDPQTKGLEVIYARAVGRGKTAEADAAWGESAANQVLATGRVTMHEPKKESGETDRLTLAHLLGLPLKIGARLSGALVFIRFGGPQYSKLHVSLASLQAFWASSLIERRDLQEARTELESIQRQMRLQDDFVSTISHELRTPLGFIKGYSTSLLRQDTTWDKETQLEFLTIIDEEADRLTQLIDNMLESARLQSKTLQFKFSPLRLDALVRDVTTRVKMYHRDLDVNLDFEKIPPIRGDGVRLSQVFENLFNNAIKYAPGSRLSIVMRFKDAKLEVAFADQGEGIPEDYLPFIFERFYRVPGENGTTGTGLGLYICKQIILAHHGKIWAESVVDKGTTFFIQLPADPFL